MSDSFSDEPQHTEEIGGTTSWLEIQRFRVRVMAGAEAGKEAASVTDSLSIGSAEGNDVVLSDSTVSRHHCTILSTAKGFLLRDLDSTNGTRVGGFRVREAYLKPGATFKAGRTALSFDVLAENTRAPLSSGDRLGGLVGRSVAMRRLFAMIPRVAASESTVLVQGETGTGKGVLASVLHDRSPRSEGPFVVLDCASIAPTLIESQLFGHVRGAYTGAVDDHPGAFVSARGGTLFLDEIGELPLAVQPKLLRVLEERVVVPLGSVQEVPTDVRVVAATNRDLRSEVNDGGFRADLFYRLNVVAMTLPPLRERREDIPLLVEHFHQHVAPDVPAPSAAVVAVWEKLHWAGNARELRSALERLLLLGDDAWMTASQSSDAMAAFDPNHSFRAAKEIAVAQFERTFLGMLIERHGGNLSKAARAARMDRNHLRQLLRRHGIDVVKK